MIGDLPQTLDEKKAIICGKKNVTYAELIENQKYLEGRLKYKLKDVKNKKIAFLLENGIDFIQLFLAVCRAGGIAVPLDPKWKREQHTYVLLDSKPDLVIVHEKFKPCIVDSPSVNLHTWEQLYGDKNLPCHDNHTSVPPEGNDLFYIGYTSGTTGRPKGFMRTHMSWAECFPYCSDVFHLGSEDHILSPGPLVHSHFLFAAMQTLHSGATLYLCEVFDREEVFQVLNRLPISVMYIVPTMFESLLVHKQTEFYGVKRILSSGAKWDKGSKNKVRSLFPNADIIEFYGASELSFVSYLLDRDHKAKGHTVGRPFPKVQVKIIKEDGSEVSPGEVGLLSVKSPWLFDGYLNLPEESRQVIHNGWATVGDLAFMDEDGYCTIIGRKHNMIISGGLNIYPEEVENVLIQLSEINEAAVIGIPDSYWGERVVAGVSVKENFEWNEDQVINYCKGLLPSYKCPKRLLVIEEFPYTSSGKIARRELRDKLIGSHLTERMETHE
ncbi:AMP-binding protein [Halobacillus mangrovi]|uniref:AMP-binding protein n=1 Tax=Halobacillus mangrovi TaxID=402384 RepID=UPI003D993A11